MVDMNLNGAVLSLINFLKLLDYTKYNVEVFVIKEHYETMIKSLPKEVKISYLYKDNPLFDLGTEPLKKEYVLPYIINKIFAKINTKHIKKLKNSLRRIYIPAETYDAGISFDEQSYKYLKKVKANKKIVRYAYGEVVTTEDPNNKPYNFCDYVVAQSEGLKENLAYKNKVDREKIQVIHNIFDNDKIIDKSQEFYFNKINKYIFTTCARIVPLKRIDIIPLVCRILIDRGINDFKWYIIGSPEKEKYMTPIYENIKKTETEDYIEFMGQQSNPFPYIKASDIYVQTSNIDAWPRSVMEAMILGVPVLCTKTVGGKEQVNPGVTGELCELDDEKDMAEKLIYMIDNLDKYGKEIFRVNNDEIMAQYYEIF